MAEKACEPPALFRLSWRLAAVLVWLLFAYLASHTSERPDVLERYSVAYSALLAGVFACAVLITVANAPIVLRRLHGYRQVLVVLSLSFGVPLSLGEMYVRATDLIGISYYEEVARYQAAKMADPVLVYRHRPSSQGTYQGVKVSLNDYGLRDRPITEKAEDELRVLVLGDSVTFGWGVDQEKVFSSRLERLLTAEAGQSVRVINTGVGGYNTVQEYDFLKTIGLSLDPDVVLLVYVTNDVAINKGVFEAPEDRTAWGSTPVEVLTRAAGKSWLYRLGYHLATHNEPPADSVDRYHRLRTSEGWKDSMRALNQIAVVCRNGNIPLLVFFFSYETNPFIEAFVSDVRHAVAPFPVMDTSPWFEGRAGDQVINSKVDSHPNALGHRILAENMARVLLAQDVL